MSKDKAKTEKTPRSAAGREVYEWVQCIVVALMTCVLIFTFFGRVIDVVGRSMEPTLRDGDKIIITRLSWPYEAGDIVVLQKSSFSPSPIVKRIIATEGQTVDIDFEQGLVYVDGFPLDEPYTNEPTYKQEEFSGPLTVPEGCVFVLGDNRNNSQDSREITIGCVDERHILGKVVFRFLPLSHFGAIYGWN